MQSFKTKAFCYRSGKIYIYYLPFSTYYYIRVLTEITECFKKKSFRSFLCLLLTFSALAQSVSKSESPKTHVSPEIQEKALALLNGLAREAEQFSLPLNRVDARIGIANLLWEKDEKAARIIFQNAISDLNAMLVRIPPENAESDEEYNTERYVMLYEVGNLRKELLIALAARDAKFALDALQSLSVKNAEGRNIFEDDNALELELAAKIAANDPKQAYEIAKKNLENGLGRNIFTTLENLYKKDTELGTKFAQDILSKIKAQRYGHQFAVRFCGNVQFEYDEGRHSESCFDSQYLGDSIIFRFSQKTQQTSRQRQKTDCFDRE